jgi:hypothetical protein
LLNLFRGSVSVRKTFPKKGVPKERLNLTAAFHALGQDCYWAADARLEHMPHTVQLSSDAT